MNIHLYKLTVFVVLMTTATAAWAQPASFPPRPEALAALTSGPDVTVTSTREELYTFRPIGMTPSKGIILYPGALVDFRSYAPLARDLAREGYVAVIVKMPLDIAFLGYKRALLAQFINRDIRTWAIGGHSLGGVASCTFTKEFPQFVRGVVLLASYPSSSDSLRLARVKVTSIFGTLDGLTDAEDIERSKRLLPRSTTYVPIEGGNHTQFGAYWDGQTQNFVQPGDFPATISALEQQNRLADEIAHFLHRL
jgi:dienelactone hydrolase